MSSRSVALVYPEVLDMARYREKRKEFPPFGVLYVAAALEEAGHHVEIFKLTPSATRFDFRGFDAVGFSVSASATFNLFLSCRQNSLFAPGSLLMGGGVHANLYPEQTLCDLGLDVVSIGEGERTIVELVARVGANAFGDVQGVLFRVGEEVVRTAPRLMSRDIDGFPLPARHLLPVNDFVMTDRLSTTSLRMSHLMPGRGCPFPCRYCASAQTKAQFRSGKNIRAELAHMKDAYNIDGFAVVGNDFILSKSNVLDICGQIRDLDLRWATLSRVDRVDPAVLEQMAAAGCIEMEYGVESGSQRVLDAMDKRATVGQVRDALRWTKESGIHNKVFLVHGYPGEDESSTEETIRLLDEVGRYVHRVSLFRFVPLPGTYVHAHAAQFGLRGTYGSPDWEGDWGRYHIHHNHHHWWGSEADFAALTTAYNRLRDYVEARWPSKYSADELPQDRWTSLRARLPRAVGRRWESLKETWYRRGGRGT